ncbi:hypothetical protein [Bounagaea algeriensis]
MTVHDDLTRPWFQPLLPSESTRPQQHAHTAPNNDTSTEAGPLTTRIEGNLSLEDAAHPPTATSTPAHADPTGQAPVDRVEVTQPYIPAIRTEQPEFAKRLNPGPRGNAPPPPPPAAPQAPPEPASEQDTETTVALHRHTDPAPTAPPRKSWLRRAVRAIIGPDLLRKDPPKPTKRS